jgi:hypothetical protein
MSGDAPHGIYLILNCGLKLGSNQVLQGVFEKKSVELDEE